MTFVFDWEKIMRKWFCAGVVSLAGLASGANAAVVAFDAYKIGAIPANGEYQDAVALKNQPAALVNTGFANGPYASGTGTSNFMATSSGLNSAVAGATSASSGKVNWIGAGIDATNRSNARALSSVASNATYWISHVVNRGGITALGASGYALTGFGNAIVPVKGTTGSSLAGLFVGFATDTTNPTLADLVIRYRDTVTANPNATAADAILINGTQQDISNQSYTVVMKVDVNAVGAQDNVTWFLNPTDATSESTLASTSLATGNFASFALQGSTDFVRLNYAAQDWNGTAFFDEPRLSTDLAGLSLVPEPASLALGVFGLLAVGRRARRARI